MGRGRHGRSGTTSRKLLNLLSPANFDSLFYYELHNNDFNWFDLVLRGHEPITPIA